MRSRRCLKTETYKVKAGPLEGHQMRIIMYASITYSIGHGRKAEWGVPFSVETW